MAFASNAPALGTYIGAGTTNGKEVSITLRLNEKKSFWLDYSSKSVTDSECWHSEGSFAFTMAEDSVTQMVKCTIGGLPGQPRVGQVYAFIAKDAVGGGKVLVYEGINCQPQEDTLQEGPRHTCDKCGNEVVGQVLKVGDSYYHPECFTCDTCSKPLKGSFHKQPDGKKVCPECVPKNYCEACKKVIQGACTKVGGKSYHKECFACDACSKPLSGGFLTVTKGDVMHRYCDKECVSKGPSGKSAGAPAAPAAPTAAPAAAPAATNGGYSGERTCKKCKQSINGAYVLGDKDDIFHEGCFVCDDCGCKLDKFVLGNDRKFKFEEARYLCMGCGKKEETAGAESAPVNDKPCAICKKPASESPALELADGKVVHWSCFKCKDCGQAQQPGAEKTMKLFRTKVLAAIQGNFVCEPCTAILGCYQGKGGTDGDSTTFAVRLMDGNRCWLDCTTATKIASGTWHVEGPFEKIRGADGVVTSLKFTVDRRPQNTGPEVGRVFEIQILKKAGDAHDTLVCEGVSCGFQGTVPDISMEDTMPSKKPAGGGYTSAAPAPAPAAPEPEPTAADAGSQYASPTEVTLTLAELKNTDVWKPKRVDPGKREEYLSDAEFSSVFGVSKAEFAKMPKWKRDNKKKDQGIF